MPTTTEYAWTLPTEDGSTGSWDTILNEALEAVDGQMKLVEDKADDALSENLAFPVLPANMHARFQGVPSDDVALRTISSLQISDAGSYDYQIPIHGLAVGMQITGFKSRAQAVSGGSITVALYYYDSAGNTSQLSSHSHSTTLATVTKTGLTETVVADRQYFFYVIVNHGTSGASLVQYVQPTVVRV